MSEALLEKMNNIENLLLEINAKIDNFLGFEDLEEGEAEEVGKARAAVRSGDTVPFDEVFGD